MSRNNFRQNRFDRANNPVQDALEAAFRPLVFNTKARQSADAQLAALAKATVKDISRERRNAEIAINLQDSAVKQAEVAKAFKAKRDAADAIFAAREAAALEYGYVLNESGEFVPANS